MRYLINGENMNYILCNINHANQIIEKLLEAGFSFTVFYNYGPVGETKISTSHERAREFNDIVFSVLV